VKLLLTILILISGLQFAYAQEQNFFNVSKIDSFFQIFESPQALFDRLSIDFSKDISTIDLIGFSLGMVAYGIFIWHFYRFIARREIVSLQFNKYETDGKKATSIVVYIIKYLIVFPLVITTWFLVYSMFMFFLAPEMPQDLVFLVVISLVIAIRIAAYYKEDLAKDLAKMIPFSLLGIFLVSTGVFTFDQIIGRLDGFIPFISKIIAFIVFAIGIEAILRIIFLIKRKLLPIAETKLEEEIESTIDKKIKIKVEQIEDKIEKTEDKLEEKLENSEDKLEKKHEKLQDEVENSKK
jgi:hypothetical protein